MKVTEFVLDFARLVFSLRHFRSCFALITASRKKERESIVANQEVRVVDGFQLD